MEDMCQQQKRDRVSKNVTALNLFAWWLKLGLLLRQGVLDTAGPSHKPHAMLHSA
jgi:hypothetical protein